jgi:hypothetical protein
VLKDSAGNTVWDKQASTLVSVAMAPVVIAPDLATARAALGIDGLIGAETTRALAAEAALASSQAGFASAASVTAETARAEAAEAAEVARATAAEAELANSIGLSVKVMAGSGTTDASGYCRVEFSPAFASVHAFVATVAAAAALSVSTVANTDVSGADVRMITTVSYEPAMLGFTWIAVGT